MTGEESAGQVRLRAERIGALDPHLFLAAETDLGAVLGHIDAVRPALLVVDSVQTIASAEVDGSAGGVTQVREVAASLIRVAKTRGLPTILVGHVTKDGSIAGPRLLEHLVDVVLSFEGDRHSTAAHGARDQEPLRAGRRGGLLRARRRRHPRARRPQRAVPLLGPVVHRPGQLRHRDPGGSSPAGGRGAGPGGPLAVRVSATGDRRPRRRAASPCCSPSSSSAAALPLANADVYVSTVGGVRTSEPAADLAAALALASAATDRPVRGGLVAVGEVGLAGEVRRVPSIARRLSEAARLGFTHALVPPDPGPLPDGIRVRTVATLDDALRAARISGPQ